MSMQSSGSQTTKRIAFIRHGCTYMNEYLGRYNFGCPNFTDIFPSADIDKYRDSKLSARGIQQAMALANRLTKKNVLMDADLIVISPLTRAIQTYELGIQPTFGESKPPIMALPLAAERVYLISDIGRPRTALEKDYPYIDFETGFKDDDDGTLREEWWFASKDGDKGESDSTTSVNYEEWRPSSQNQRYACPGEPDDVFERRMRDLYSWLQDRPESTIAVVCHWGVIEWMLNRDFDNCEVQVVPFDQIRPLTMMKDDSCQSLFESRL